MIVSEETTSRPGLDTGSCLQRTALYFPEGEQGLACLSWPVMISEEMIPFHDGRLDGAIRLVPLPGGPFRRKCCLTRRPAAFCQIFRFSAAPEGAVLNRGLSEDPGVDVGYQPWPVLQSVLSRFPVNTDTLQPKPQSV